MAIQFLTIPATIRTPGVFVEIDGSQATSGVQQQPHNSLLLGQKTTAGAADAATIYAIDSVDEGVALFGNKSQLALMIAAYKAADSLTPLYAAAVADDGSGVAATGKIEFAGTAATEGRELVLYAAGRRVSVPVIVGDTPTTIETAALTAFANYSGADPLPVTVAADSGTGVDFTAVSKGTAGNGIMLGHSQLPGERPPLGITVTVTPMASGATDPSYSTLVTAMGEDQYHTIAAGLATATPVGLLVNELESRWGPMRQIEGHLFVAAADTRANLTTLGNSFNSAQLTLLGLEKNALLKMPAEVAAAVAGENAASVQIDPSVAMTGVSVAGFSGARIGTRFTRAERDILLSDGVSTFTVAQDGRLLIERLITTYQTNSLSLPDAALYDLTTVRTLAALRYSLRTRIGVKFARFKLADDGVNIPGQKIASPGVIRSEIIALYGDWTDLGWVEAAGLEQFKAELLVQRDPSDPNRINAILPPNLINSLLVTAASLQFRR